MAARGGRLGRHDAHASLELLGPANLHLSSLSSQARRHPLEQAHRGGERVSSGPRQQRNSRSELNLGGMDDATSALLREGAALPSEYDFVFFFFAP